MNQPTIVLVHIGSGSLPDHLFDSIAINFQIAPRTKIVCLANTHTEVQFKQELAKRLGDKSNQILFEPIEKIPESKESKSFQETTSLNKEFRDGFWINASRRFFVLSDYLSHTRLQDVIHLENDYILFFDPAEKLDAFRSHGKFSAPLDRSRCIPGIVWIKNPDAGRALVQFLVNKSHLGDMDSLNGFIESNEDSNPLPTISSSYVLAKGLDLKRYSSGYELFEGIFDAAAIGQYLGGIDWMNSPEDTTFFQNESSDLLLQEYIFSWNMSNGIRKPVLRYGGEEIQVLGLHVHSKRLQGLSPLNNGTHFDLETLVTGERIQAICDLTISTPSITKFHGRSNIKSKTLIELGEDVDGNLLSPIVELVKQINYAKTIFVYTHLIPYFAYYLAPKISREFTLVTHNSDHAVTIQDLELLNNPNLKGWFAQNVEFSHEKLHALPIGLQNQQWGTEKLSQIIGISKSIKKTKLIYANFSEDTHPARKEAGEKIKSINFCTIEKNKTYTEYLSSIAEHKFCICPRGNGLDTHRFWEAQYLDCIPVILWKDWSASYSDLPVLILDTWSDLNKIDLEKVYINISTKRFSRDSLNLKFISQKILSA